MKTPPLLPADYLSGFRMARNSDEVFRQQLLRDGYEEVTHRIRGSAAGWGRWKQYMGWVASIGHRFYAPPWLVLLSERIAPILGEAELVAFLKRGDVETNARALVAAYDLAPGTTETEKCKAVLLCLPKDRP